MLYNIPEALHGLREGQKRACHQPEFTWAWEGAVQVCSNLGGSISCIHSDPGLGALAPGETAVRRGRLWFGEWDLDGLYRRHMRGAGR